MDVAGWGLLENVPERAGEEVLKRGEKRAKRSLMINTQAEKKHERTF